MDNLIGKYFGPNKICGFNTLDRKTYLGNEVLELLLDDETKREVPTAMVAVTVTDKQSDLTALREAYVKPLIEKIIAILLDGEIQIVDIEFLLATTSTTLNMHLEKANEILWQKDLMKRNLADIQKILITQAKKDDQLQKDNKVPEGGGISKDISDSERNRKTPKKKKSK